MTQILNKRRGLHGWNPHRMDPTRTTALRRRFLGELRRRFKEVKRRIVELVKVEDAFGLTTNLRRKLASTQVDLPDLKHDLKLLQQRLGPADVVKLEDKPHVTVRYGFTEDVPDEVQFLIKGRGPAYLTLKELGSFSNDEDVLFVRVESDDLHAIHELLDQVPNETEHDYHPHMTVAYLKKGTAQKYLGLENPLDGVGVETSAITFSSADRQTKTPLSLNQRFAFMSHPDQVKAFASWLAKQLQSQIVGRDENELWRRFVKEGFEQGAGRSWSDVRQSQLREERPELFTPEAQDSLRDFYEGSKEEFLRSAFGRPVAIEKVKLLASRTFTDLKDVTTAMAGQIRRTLTDGLVQGKHSTDVAAELAERVDVGLARAEAIARTEISRAYSEGQLDALEQMGVTELGVMVEWSTAADSEVCPLCLPLEGAVLPIEDARGMLPRHPNCRCAWIPANVGEDKTGQKRGKAADRAVAKSERAG